MRSGLDPRSAPSRIPMTRPGGNRERVVQGRMRLRARRATALGRRRSRRARDPVLGALVQHRTPARPLRSHPTRRVRDSPRRCPTDLPHRGWKTKQLSLHQNQGGSGSAPSKGRLLGVGLTERGSLSALEDTWLWSPTARERVLGSTDFKIDLSEVARAVHRRFWWGTTLVRVERSDGSCVTLRGRDPVLAEIFEPIAGSTRPRE